jgi:glycosyltransferase involved in cell wall biosynthesis
MSHPSRAELHPDGAVRPLEIRVPRVMLVVPWDQEHGGVASVVENLARYLQRNRHAVMLFHPGEPVRATRRTTKRGFDGYELNLRSPFVPEHPVRSVSAFLLMLLPTLYRLAALLRAQRVDVVHIHYPLAGFVYFGLLRWLLPFRLVVTVHGSDLFPRGNRPPRYPWSLRLLLRAADAIVAPSRAFRGQCVAALPQLEQRALAIHNGIQVAEFAAADPGTATQDGDPYLLCIAAHNEKKAVDVLLRAFALLSPQHPDLRLLLVGDGPLRGELEALARELALGTRVEFLGQRARPEVARLMRGCCVFVLPSRAEPFGMVVAEALACGRPVVASAVGGIPEIVEDGRCGVLVPPDDPDAIARAVSRMLTDDALRASFGEQGRARARARFDAEVMGQGYARLYADLTAGARADRAVTNFAR